MPRRRKSLTAPVPGSTVMATIEQRKFASYSIALGGSGTRCEMTLCEEKYGGEGDGGTCFGSGNVCSRNPSTARRPQSSRHSPEPTINGEAHGVSMQAICYRIRNSTNFTTSGSVTAGPVTTTQDANLEARNYPRRSGRLTSRSAHFRRGSRILNAMLA